MSGIGTIVTPGTEHGFLAPLPVRAMSGIGVAAESALARVGIRTLGQLAEASDGLLSPIFGINTELVRRRAAGLEVSEVRAIDAPDDVKSISNERTFAHDLTDPSDVKAAIQLLSESVGARLRRRGLAGRTVTLKLKYSFGEGRTIHLTDPSDVKAAIQLLSESVGARLRRRGLAGRTVTLKLKYSFGEGRTIQRKLAHATDDENVFGAVACDLLASIWTSFGEGRTIQRKLAHATDDENVFGAVACDLLASIWTEGMHIRLAGVGVSDFWPDHHGIHTDLFCAVDERGAMSSDKRNLAVTLDALRDRFGNDAVAFGRSTRFGGDLVDPAKFLTQHAPEDA